MAGTRNDNLIAAAFPNAVVGEKYTLSGFEGKTEVTYQGSDKPAATPEKITFPKDAREAAAAQDPKNTFQHATRSGHLFEMNDNAEGEHITLQHRAGSMVQFTPDGKIHISAHDGMFTAVFGTNVMYITGTYDVVVDGSASMKVKGDYNVTVDGDLNTTVSGNMNTVVGKNHNTAVTRQIAVTADTEVHRTKTGLELTTEGFMNIFSGAFMYIQSITSTIWMQAKQDFRIDADVRLGIYSKSTIKVKSKAGMKIIDASGIDLNP